MCLLTLLAVWGAGIHVCWAQGGAKAKGLAEAVDVALVLAVDVSRSMSREELRMQREGYAAAIADPAVVQAIQQGAYGRIALTFFEWASSYHAKEIIGWTVIETQDDARQVAARLLAHESLPASRTSISGAIRHAVSLFDSVPYRAERRVIDISGDGPNNEGSPVAEARDRALAAGIVINGLPLLTRGGFYSAFNLHDLDVYYLACVTGGPASFVVPVTEWAHFPQAVRRKLVLEIGGVVPDGEEAPWEAAGLGAPSLPRPAAAQPGWRPRSMAVRASAGGRLFKAQYRSAPSYDCLRGEKIWKERRSRMLGR